MLRALKTEFRSLVKNASANRKTTITGIPPFLIKHVSEMIHKRSIKLNVGVAFYNKEFFLRIPMENIEPHCGPILTHPNSSHLRQPRVYDPACFSTTLG